MSLNKNLSQARVSRNDEFYTQLKDIENELRHYKDHFKGKTVYCNADDPRVSNFFHYFSYNFEYLGLKKLITTCYKNQEMDLFSMHDQESAIALVYEGEKDNGRVPTVENIGVIELSGDGDFRSSEAIEFLKEADIVVTNPPFSLFREYISQLIDYDKEFLVIGNINALTYKEIFPLIRENKLWLGYNSTRFFLQPDGSVFETARTYWFTNIDTERRNEEMLLYKKYNPTEYPTYDNYNAIEVSRVADIPKDYEGVMGVPITFLHKYNPDQFEILGMAKTPICFENEEEAKRTKIYENVVQHSRSGKKSSGNQVNAGPTIIVDTPPAAKTFYTTDDINGYIVAAYARILIKNKKVVK